jgi:hypothetical protein
MRLFAKTLSSCLHEAQIAAQWTLREEAKYYLLNSDKYQRYVRGTVQCQVQRPVTLGTIVHTCRLVGKESTAACLCPYHTNTLAWHTFPTPTPTPQSTCKLTSGIPHRLRPPCFQKFNRDIIRLFQMFFINHYIRISLSARISRFHSYDPGRAGFDSRIRNN